MKSLTYEGWKDIGYYVKRGEKSLIRNKKDEPVFSRDQVEEATDIGDYIQDPYMEDR